jgi:hypothetical protein
MAAKLVSFDIFIKTLFSCTNVFMRDFLSYKEREEKRSPSYIGERSRLKHSSQSCRLVFALASEAAAQVAATEKKEASVAARAAVKDAFLRISVLGLGRTVEGEHRRRRRRLLFASAGSSAPSCLRGQRRL